jgi:putative addiction module CopG family antidote
MNVVISPELERFVQEQVETGRFASPSEVFEAGLARLMLDGEFDEEDLRAFEEAERQIAAGETVDLKMVRAEYKDILAE